MSDEEDKNNHDIIQHAISQLNRTNVVVINASDSYLLAFDIKNMKEMLDKAEESGQPYAIIMVKKPAFDN